MSRTAIERLIDAIEYPERVPDGATAATLRVDGREVVASISGGRIVLSQRISSELDKLPSLAGFAAGRMLREDAVLAYGDGGAFLWMDASAGADERTLARLFESFMDSCDWWLERVDGGEGEASPQFSEMVIRP